MNQAGALAAGGKALRNLADIVVGLARRAERDRVSGLAAEVAFYAALSLFPGLLILASALGWLDRLIGHELARRSEKIVLDFLQEVLTEQASGVIADARDLFRRQRGEMLTSAALVAVYATSRGFSALVRALDLAYGVQARRSRLNLQITGLALGVGNALIVALVLGMVVVGPLLGFGQEVARLVGYRGMLSFAWNWLCAPTAFVLLILWTATFFHLGPNRHTPWRRDLPGAVLAASLWLLVSLCFSLYLRLASAGNQVFGVLGGGLVLLMWLYILCLALLLGGELNALLMERSNQHPAGGRRRG